LEIPVGAIPTTFADRFPDAVVPGNPKVPLILHPKYQEYLRAFFKELLETYPLDGFVLLRDDNGGLDNSKEFVNYVAASRTKHQAWEQHLMIYDLLRASGFRGDIAVYPYHDLYQPHLDSALPKDLFIVGHGSGLGTLTRNYQTLGPMGDTWLDNLYAGFRLPPAARMKRYIADRGCYWIGGAFRGTELPLESIGTFTWQSTGTINTLRHEWGSRAFGEKNGLLFLRFSDAYERLWNLMNVPLLPSNWLNLNFEQKKQIEKESTEGLKLYEKRLAELRSSANEVDNKDWFAQVKLYGTFFEYCLRRLQLFGQIYEVVLTYKDTLEASKPLPVGVRTHIDLLYRELLDSAQPYANEIKKVPGGMMRATEPSAHPYKEWREGGWGFTSGWGPELDKMLKIPQFGGTLTVLHEEVKAGGSFTLRVELYNGGVCPWLPSAGHKLKLDPAVKGFGLPLTWDLSGEGVFPGDRRVVNLPGTAPEEPGTTSIRITFWQPSGPNAFPFIHYELLLKWA
jgi:hypothetical protein